MALMSFAEFARHMGVEPGTVGRWRNKGLLFYGTNGKVDSDKSKRSIEQRPDTYRGGRTSKTVSASDRAGTMREAVTIKESYLAMLRQYEYDTKTGLVIQVEAVSKIVAAQYAIVRQHLVGIGASIAPAVAILNDPVQCKAVIDRAVERALEGLSAYDVDREARRKALEEPTEAGEADRGAISEGGETFTEATDPGAAGQSTPDA